MENKPETVFREDINENPAAKKTSSKKKRKKQSAGIAILRTVLVLLIIAVGVFGVLYIVAKASAHESLGAMLRHMQQELSLMWQRITK